MNVWRFAGAVALAGCGLAAAPASAQFFLQSKDLSGERVLGDEPGMAQALAGATPAERKAALTWQLRAALNVAALQCQFEQTMPTVTNYNALLTDHQVELKGAFDTLTKYFVRTAKSKAAGQTALDTFSTRTYASVTPVASQYNFCQVTNMVGRDAAFTPRGHLGELAEMRMREVRNSLVPFGEQRFPRYIGRDVSPSPRLDPICWSKKGEWVDKKCGTFTLVPLGTGVAAR